jgi:hypothetical protein
MADPLNPLQWDSPIVDVQTGRPTLSFLRAWAQQRNINAEGLTFPAPPDDASRYLSGTAVPTWKQVLDSELSLSDVTTNNATSSRHGFLPKLSNVSTEFLNGQGAFATPSGGGALDARGLTIVQELSMQTALTLAANFISFRPVWLDNNILVTGVELLLTGSWTGGTIEAALYSLDSNHDPGTQRATSSTTASLSAGINQIAFGSTYTTTAAGLFGILLNLQGTSLTTGPARGARTRYFQSRSGTGWPTAPITTWTLANGTTQNDSFFWLY